MSLLFKPGARSAIALAVAGGAVLSGIALAGSAHAAAPPTFEPDPNAVGFISLFDQSGSPLTTGSLTAPFAYYFVGDGAATPGSTGAASLKATAYATTPIDNSDPQNWNAGKLTPSTTYGTTASANYPGTLKNSPNAIAVNTGNNTLGAWVSNAPSASAKDPNIYEIRVITGDATHYYRLDVQVNGNTWTQVYPAPPAATPSISAITANPASPVTAGTTVNLSATVSNPVAGSVHLLDNSADKGAVTYNATTGAISATDTPATGSHSYTFALTPADTSSKVVTSPALAYTVNAPVTQDTTTVVSGPTTGTVGDTVTYTATVKAGTTAVGTNAGSVQFKVDGTNVGAPVAVVNGAATFGYNLADTSSHTITAAFTHTSGQLYNDSADATGVTVTATAATTAPDPQDVVVNVPAGTLVISTPYTAANPFVLGNLVLDPNGTGYSASANFGDTSAPTGSGTADAAATTGTLPAGATPAQVDAAKAAQQGAAGNGTGNGITITDTRANSQGWVASAQTTDFTNAALNTPINGDNLTFHDLRVKYIPGNAMNPTTAPIAVNNIDHFKGAKKSFANNVAKNTPGTVAIAGVLTLNAPTSTKAGQYTATITFTIV